MSTVVCITYLLLGTVAVIRITVKIWCHDKKRTLYQQHCIYRWRFVRFSHYGDVVMGTVASQITSLTIVYSTVYSVQIKENNKALRHWPLCGDFTGAREFHAQMASNAENGSIWWRHQVYVNFNAFVHALKQSCDYPGMIMRPERCAYTELYTTIKNW